MSDEFLPLFINLTGKKCLVVGGGKIAYRKAKTLLKYGAIVTIITREINHLEIDALEVELVTREYKIGDTHGYFLVVAATDSFNINKTIFEEANVNNILVNNIMDKDYCNTRFCAVLSEEDCIIGVSTKGKDPSRAIKIRDKIEEIL